MKASWWRWLIRAGTVASFGLIGWFLWQHMADLSAVEWRKMAGPVGLGLVLYGLALGIQGTVWIALFAQLTATPWSWEDAKTYVATHLMRRLPGVPWYMAGRAIAYRERGPEASRAALVVSMVEWGGTILSGLAWVAWDYGGWCGMLSVIGAVLLTMAGLRHWRWSTRWPLLKRLPISSLYAALAGYGVQWFLAAWMLFLLLKGLAPEHAPSLLETGGLWAISGVVSSLAVFAPAGLGIREVSLVALLEPWVGVSYAALAALLMRAMFIVGDLLWGVMVGWLIPHLILHKGYCHHGAKSVLFDQTNST